VKKVKDTDISEKTNAHKTLDFVMNGYPFMTGRLKNRNITKRDGVTTAELVMKTSSGTRHRVVKISIEGLSGWEGWHMVDDQGGFVIITRGKEKGTVRLEEAGRFWPKVNAIKIKGQKFAIFSSDWDAPWDIPQAIRFIYIMTTKPKPNV
jgi:hypothetical protein